MVSFCVWVSVVVVVLVKVWLRCVFCSIVMVCFVVFFGFVMWWCSLVGFLFEFLSRVVVLMKVCLIMSCVLGFWKFMFMVVFVNFLISRYM